MTPDYLAGFLDGEGSFRVNGSSIGVTITNTHKAILDEIQASWGGSIRIHTQPTDRHRRAFQWTLYGGRAEDLIKEVLPLLREKRIQALLLLEYRSLGAQDPIRPWIKTALGQLKRLESPA